MNDNKNQIMVLGAEAASHGAIDAGAKGIFCYPGTPSTEVFEGAEALVHELNDGRVAKIGANEKVAFEFALGTSYAGFRTMVTMKHVGLNVAMDAFVNSAITGINGGLVVLVADDPSMHSSQNEQDSRYLADFAHIPCLEPSNPQEVYEFTRKAFELSEKLKLPVMLRLVTRLAHSRGPINKTTPTPIVSLGNPKGDDKKRWVLIPANAKVQYRKLREKLGDMIQNAEEFNSYSTGSKKIGVVTAGMGKAYFDQLGREDKVITEYTRYDICGYPIDQELLKKITNECDEVFVFEEDYPYLEDQMVALSRHAKVKGRRDNTLTIDGELTPRKLRVALGLEIPGAMSAASIALPARPPKLCDGCGHIDAFNALTQAFKNIGVKDYNIFGDIGCYTLGALEPYFGIQATVEMGASVGMALGAAYAGMNHPTVGVIGDSTFFHSGLPTLMSLARAEVNATFVIMDNRITGMTGQQETVTHDVIPEIAKAAGVPEANIHILIPLPKNHEENTKKMEAILKHDGPDVVIFKRDCIQALRKNLYKKFGIK